MHLTMKHENPISTISLISLGLFLFLFLFVYRSHGAEQEQEPSCSDELVRFSVCLPFVSSSPNNLTDTPPPHCCDGLYSPNHSLCLCYLLRHPPILGFPINSSRFFLLPQLCPYSKPPTISLQSLCQGSLVLPPLHSITGLNNERPRYHPEQQSQAEGGGNLADYDAQEPTADSTTEPNSEMPTSNYEKPTSTRSSTTMLMKNRCYWGLLSVIFVCLSWFGTSYLMNI